MTGRPAPASVLVYVGLDLIGDGLMKLPFLRALRNAFPAAQVTWLAGKGATAFAHALRPLADGLIDEIIENAGIGLGWSEALGRPLPGRRFDLILDTQRRLVTTLAVRRIRHGIFVSGCAGYLLSDLRPPGALAGAYRKPPAMIGQMLELVALARFGRPDGPVDCSGKVTLPHAVVAEAARLLPAGGRYVAMAPGAGMRIKCWPLDRFAELGRRLAGRGLTPVYILGPQEADWRATLEQAVPGALFPLAEAVARGGPDPLLTIAIAARAQACVANDSGGGHLFAASNTPLVSLFGPTAPEKFAPRVPSLTIVEARRFGATDMAAIPLDAVADAVERLLAPQRAGA